MKRAIILKENTRIVALIENQVKTLDYLEFVKFLINSSEEWEVYSVNVRHKGLPSISSIEKALENKVFQFHHLLKYAEVL